MPFNSSATGTGGIKPLSTCASHKQLFSPARSNKFHPCKLTPRAPYLLPLIHELSSHLPETEPLSLGFLEYSRASVIWTPWLAQCRRTFGAVGHFKPAKAPLLVFDNDFAVSHPVRVVYLTSPGAKLGEVDGYAM